MLVLCRRSTYCSSLVRSKVACIGHPLLAAFYPQKNATSSMRNLSIPTRTLFSPSFCASECVALHKRVFQVKEPRTDHPALVPEIFLARIGDALAGSSGFATGLRDFILSSTLAALVSEALFGPAPVAQHVFSMECIHRRQQACPAAAAAATPALHSRCCPSHHQPLRPNPRRGR